MILKKKEKRIKLKNEYKFSKGNKPLLLFLKSINN